MFAITINQGGIIGALINQDALELPEGASHFVVNEQEFETPELLADYIAELSQENKDPDVTWRFRLGTHDVDVEQLRILLAARGVNLTAIEAPTLQGPGTVV